MKRMLQVLVCAGLALASQNVARAQNAVPPQTASELPELRALESDQTRETTARLKAIAARLRPLLVDEWSGATTDVKGGRLIARFHADAEKAVQPDGWWLDLNSVQEATYFAFRPQEPRTESETIWVDTFRLNARETDGVKTAQATRAAPQERRVGPHEWPYELLELLAREGLTKPMPLSLRGRPWLERDWFASAIEPLLRAIDNSTLSAKQSASLAEPEIQVALRDLTREFAGKLALRGVMPKHPATFFILAPGVRNELLIARLTSGARADVAKIEAIKSALNGWALDEMQAALALPEGRKYLHP